ncbi:deoxyhypusine synthase family protein [Elusimicrobiota bacterium]
MKKVHTDIFTKKSVPFSIEKNSNAASILSKMSNTAFQGRSLGEALRVWEKALKNDSVIYFGLSGALTPAGMRKVICFLIENRLIDVIVSTGANLFHDVHQSLGGVYYQCSPCADDRALRQNRYDRMYDVAASDKEFEDVDWSTLEFAKKLENRGYTTREFFFLMGKEVAKQEEDPGIVTTAYRNNVPIFCPAVTDSSFGLAIATGKARGQVAFSFDVINDINEMAYFMKCLPNACEIIMGGGTPKNYIQQTAVFFDLLTKEDKTLQYCVQITQDTPQWGGLSGCTFQESMSWGKIHHTADQIACYCDATIALPLLTQALADNESWKLRKNIPKWDLASMPKLKPAEIEPPSSLAKG